MKKYAVQQGVLSPSGNGDFTEYNEFDNLDLATLYFESVKKTTKNWIIPKNHILRSELIIIDSERPEDYEILDSYEVSKND